MVPKTIIRKTVIGIASFSESEFVLLKQLAVDRDALNDNFQDWRANADNVIRMVESNGLRAIEIPLTLADIHVYCVEHGLENTGAARAKLAQSRVNALVDQEIFLGDPTR